MGETISKNEISNEKYISNFDKNNFFVKQLEDISLGSIKIYQN